MKCPILEIGWMQTKVGDKGVSSDCLLERCAWWDEVKVCCGERTKRLQLERIADILAGIAKKRPHEEQFRK